VDYASDLRAWLANRPDDNGVVASFHNYGGHLCHNEACWDEVIAPIAAEAPVVTGEFGETDCQTSNVETFMDWADRHGVGYLMWAWWVLPDTACSTLSVLADVHGTPRAPNGTALKAHLASLAPRVSLGGATQALDTAVEIGVRCSKACFATTSGRLVAAGRSFRLKPASRVLAAGRKRTLALKVPRKARLAAKSALSRHRSVSARITIVVGAGSRKTISVKLRRP
jgi:cellulase (glycosyl hydrolase family 5)